MKKRYHNLTDHSVIVDEEGRAVDGGAFFSHEETEQIRQAVETGSLNDLGELENDEEGEEDDTIPASDEDKPGDETLAPRTRNRKSASQNKEK